MAIRPDWLTDQLLEKILNSEEEEEEEGGNVKVEWSDISMATKPGDNYASAMYRATVNILKNDQKQKISLVIKAELPSSELGKFVAESDLFEREMDVFLHAIPSMRKILDETAPGKFPRIGAKCYYVHRGAPASFLVFEDLKEQGFRLADHGKGLDIDHCRLAIRTLAAYHAASVAIVESEPRKFERFERTAFSEGMKDGMEKMFCPIIDLVIEEAKNWPEFNEESINKLKEINTNLFECFVVAANMNAENFNVLCHGDVWLNNMMFRYSEETGKVLDIRFVDYQACQYSSPAMDLLYFINANTCLDVLEYQNDLIDEYYKMLCDNLSILGCGHRIPARSHLYEQIEKNHAYGVLCGITLRSVIYADKDAKLDLEKALKDEESIKLNEASKKNIRSALNIFHRKGWL